jgi:hypothetical protein
MAGCVSLESTHFTVLDGKADMFWLMKNEHFETIFYILLTCELTFFNFVVCNWSPLEIHFFYITFHGSKVSRNDCRMWNKPYKYKNTYTVQLKYPKSTYTHTYINQNTVN